MGMLDGWEGEFEVCVLVALVNGAVCVIGVVSMWLWYVIDGLYGGTW